MSAAMSFRRWSRCSANTSSGQCSSRMKDWSASSFHNMSSEVAHPVLVTNDMESKISNEDNWNLSSRLHTVRSKWVAQFTPEASRSPSQSLCVSTGLYSTPSSPHSAQLVVQRHLEDGCETCRHRGFLAQWKSKPFIVDTNYCVLYKWVLLNKYGVLLLLWNYG